MEGEPIYKELSAHIACHTRKFAAAILTTSLMQVLSLQLIEQYACGKETCFSFIYNIENGHVLRKKMLDG